jgi:hypothetical protein
VGARFLPWSTANATALESGAERFEVEIEGGVFSQQPQKYHARSLKALKERYAACPDKGRLDPILNETGCLTYLT